MAGLLLVYALALLTAEVHQGRLPVRVDHAVARAMPGPHATGLGRAALDLAHLVTLVATPQLVIAVTLLLVAGLSLKERSADALTVLVPRVVALVVAVLLGKHLLVRPGPPGSRPNDVFGYYPSGHTATALVCVGTLALLAARRRPEIRITLYVVAGAWTALVGTGLVLHRYHWLSDVVASLLLGTLILMMPPVPRLPPDG